MKIETNVIRQELEKVKDGLVRPVDDSNLLVDMNDKMFNFGVLRMYYEFSIRITELEGLAKGVSA